MGAEMETSDSGERTFVESPFSCRPETPHDTKGRTKHDMQLMLQRHTIIRMTKLSSRKKVSCY